MSLSKKHDFEMHDRILSQFLGKEFFEEYGDPIMFLDAAEDSDLISYYLHKGRAFAAAIIKVDCVLMLSADLKDKEVLKVTHHLTLAGYKNIIGVSNFGKNVIHDFVSKGKRQITLMNVDRIKF